MCRSAGFGGKYLNTSHTEYREYGYSEKYDSQSADPLRHATPEEQTVGEFFYIV